MTTTTSKAHHRIEGMRKAVDKALDFTQAGLTVAQAVALGRQGATVSDALEPKGQALTVAQTAQLYSLAEYANKVGKEHLALITEPVTADRLLSVASNTLDVLRANYDFMLSMTKRLEIKACEYEHMASTYAGDSYHYHYNHASAVVLRLQILTYSIERMAYRRAVSALDGMIVTEAEENRAKRFAVNIREAMQGGAPAVLILGSGDYYALSRELGAHFGASQCERLATASKGLQANINGLTLLPSAILDGDAQARQAGEDYTRVIEKLARTYEGDK